MYKVLSKTHCTVCMWLLLLNFCPDQVQEKTHRIIIHIISMMVKYRGDSGSVFDLTSWTESDIWLYNWELMPFDLHHISDLYQRCRELVHSRRRKISIATCSCWWRHFIRSRGGTWVTGGNYTESIVLTTRFLRWILKLMFVTFFLVPFIYLS